MSLENTFDYKKREYFLSLGLKARPGLRLHKNPGRHFELIENGERTWRDVPEHVLVVSARAMVLADLLDLSDEVKEDLRLASSAHDFSKRHEKELEMPAGGITWEIYERKVAEFERATLAKSGFPERVIRIIEHTGHDGVLKVEDILNKDGLSEEEVASIILFYVDAYTRGSEWVSPAEFSDRGLINEIDRRTKKNLQNPTLKNLNEQGKTYFGGKTMSQAIGDTAHLTGKRLASLLEERAQIEIDPKRIPEFLDEEIRKRIRDA